MKFTDIVKKDWYLYLLILVGYLFGLSVYSKLPSQIPSHWNTAGQIDNYFPRMVGVLLLPTVCLGMLILFEVLPLIDPKKYNYALFLKSYQLFKVVFIVFMLVLYAVTIFVALGFALNVDLIVTSGIGILFMILGNYLSKIQPNYFIGFKLPWTLANDYVWKKTHRLGGWLMFLNGLLILISGFVWPNALGVIIIVTVVLLVVVPSVYAYLIYKNHEKGHDK